MKIYSQTLELTSPTSQRFWVAPFSDYKLGIKVTLRGETAPGSFKVYQDGAELTADDDLTGGFTTYALNSGNASSTFKVEYSNEDEVLIQTFAIQGIVTDSTVFEVGGEGGSMPEGNFVKSVNGEYPVNSNVDVAKLKTEDGWITGDGINSEFEQVQNALDNKADLTAIVPVAPSTAAADGALAGAKSTAEFVNSSIATNTANFKGTFTSEGDFPTEATNNDYLFFDTTDDAGNRIFKRYKYVDGSGWQYEYTLNNSSFTAAQWASVNSGITAEDVADMAKKSELDANTMTLAGEYADGEAFSFTVYVKNS